MSIPLRPLFDKDIYLAFGWSDFVGNKFQRCVNPNYARRWMIGSGKTRKLDLRSVPLSYSSLSARNDHSGLGRWTFTLITNSTSEGAADANANGDVSPLQPEAPVSPTIPGNEPAAGDLIRVLEPTWRRSRRWRSGWKGPRFGRQW